MAVAPTQPPPSPAITFWLKVSLILVATTPCSIPHPSNLLDHSSHPTYTFHCLSVTVTHVSAGELEELGGAFGFVMAAALPLVPYIYKYPLDRLTAQSQIRSHPLTSGISLRGPPHLVQTLPSLEALISQSVALPLYICHRAYTP